MPDFNAKMHQNRFRLELCPRPCWGSLQRSPDPLAELRGPTSKGRRENGKGRGRVGKGTGRGGERRGGEGTRPYPFTPPIHISGYALSYFIIAVMFDV